MPIIPTAGAHPRVEDGQAKGVRAALVRYIVDNYCLQFQHCNLRSHMCIYGIEASNRWCLICKSYTSN